VTNLSELIHRTLGETVAVETVLAAGLWQVEIDANELEAAILNLAVNARDAMPGGGHLTIETANTHIDEAYAANYAEVSPGQYVGIYVSDSGKGMDHETLVRAFEPFYTTKPVGRGTGLGLSQVYGFVKQSGGHVKIYSEVGEGTTVKIYLPRHHGVPAEEDEVDTHLDPHALEGDGEVVLVVDDEPTIRMLVSDVLGELGYQSLEAGDATSAMKVLESDARIDLLITDVGMPGGMNGRQLADAARQARPDLKVLFITGYAENAAITNGHLEPGMHVVSKPFAMDKLAGRIRSIIAGGG
jgi:CheY-like chemotaxis protein